MKVRAQEHKNSIFKEIVLVDFLILSLFTHVMSGNDGQKHAIKYIVVATQRFLC